MNSFSIDIFSDPPNSSNSSNSSNSLLAFRPESSSLSAPKLMPLTNDERFNQNRLINGKTKYEEENTIIKSLEEEIVTMKHKMSFVYEKDEEIGKLKEEIATLKKQNEEIKGYIDEVQKLRIDNKQLSEDLEIANLRSTNVQTLISENKLLKEKISNLSNKDIIDEIEEIEDIQTDEMIQINVPQLREVLLKRLKNKQEEHINSLINTYGFNKRSQVKRSIMEKMLEQAIHL